jgi:hypothetical protein
MDLPRWHATEITTVPGANGYLAADPKRISAWRDRLSKMTGPRVGLVWAGNRRAETGLFFGRSTQLAALRPLLATPGVNFISLQKDADQAELAREPFTSIITLPELDAGSDAFLDTAAVLRCVDLLVTSDTSVAHLAGALGVPTWLCLKHFPDWRWMFRGTNTPWYHSLRLFRQTARADWSGLYADVAVHLGRWSRQLLRR